MCELAAHLAMHTLSQPCLVRITPPQASKRHKILIKQRAEELDRQERQEQIRGLPAAVTEKAAKRPRGRAFLPVVAAVPLAVGTGQAGGSPAGTVVVLGREADADTPATEGVVILAYEDARGVLHGPRQ